jgi:hypothetical protein
MRCLGLQPFHIYVLLLHIWNHLLWRIVADNKIILLYFRTYETSSRYIKKRRRSLGMAGPKQVSPPPQFRWKLPRPPHICALQYCVFNCTSIPTVLLPVHSDTVA